MGPLAGAAPSPPPDVLYHVVTRVEWQHAVRRGRLEELPFLHLCTAGQLPGVVDRYYRDRPDVVVLAVDPAALGGDVRWEAGVDPTTGSASAVSGERFPHLYGPLPAAAIVEVLPRPGH
jgi:uncharacterized protein (DUF952 family)